MDVGYNIVLEGSGTCPSNVSVPQTPTNHYCQIIEHTWSDPGGGDVRGKKTSSLWKMITVTLAINHNPGEDDSDKSVSVEGLTNICTNLRFQSHVTTGCGHPDEEGDDNRLLRQNWIHAAAPQTRLCELDTAGRRRRTWTDDAARRSASSPLKCQWSLKLMKLVAKVTLVQQVGLCPSARCVRLALQRLTWVARQWRGHKGAHGLTR